VQKRNNLCNEARIDCSLGILNKSCHPNKRSGWQLEETLSEGKPLSTIHKPFLSSLHRVQTRYRNTGSNGTAQTAAAIVLHCDIWLTQQAPCQPTHFVDNAGSPAHWRPGRESPLSPYVVFL